MSTLLICIASVIGGLLIGGLVVMWLVGRALDSSIKTFGPFIPLLAPFVKRDKSQ